MKTRKYKQRGGSKTPYTPREKMRLRRVGFTDEQIKYLNAIKKDYGLDSLNAAGILYIIQENNNGMTPDAYTASYDKNIYPTLGDTDNEEDTDDDDNGETQLGGKKPIRRKITFRYSTKRETRRRRRRSKSIKRTKHMRKICRKICRVK